MFERTRERLDRSIGTINHSDKEDIQVCRNELDEAEQVIKRLEKKIRSLENLCEVMGDGGREGYASK